LSQEVYFLPSYFATSSKCLGNISRRVVTLNTARCPSAPSHLALKLSVLLIHYQTSVQKTKLAGKSSDFIGVRVRVLVVCPRPLPLLSYTTVLYRYDRSMLFSTRRCTQGSAGDWIPHIPVCPLTDHARAVSRGCETLFRAHATLAPLKNVPFATPITVLSSRQHHQPPKP
jgi:hypothetical protein